MESASKANRFHLVDRSVSPSASPEVVLPPSPSPKAMAVAETGKRKTKFFYSPILKGGDIPLLLQRPLLSFSRVDVKRICLLWQLPTYPDASNWNLKYARNRLRKQMLPALRLHLNPQLDGMVIHFTKLAAAEQIYVEYLSQRVSSSIYVLGREHIALHVGGLISLPLALRRRILKESLERYVTTSLHLSHVEDLSTFLEKSSLQEHSFPGKSRLYLLPLREEEWASLRIRPLSRPVPTQGWSRAKNAFHCSILPPWTGAGSNEQRGFFARYLNAVRGRVPSISLYPPEGHLGGRTIFIHTALTSSLPWRSLPQGQTKKLEGSTRPLGRASGRRGEHFGIAMHCFLPSVGNFLLLRLYILPSVR